MSMACDFWSRLALHVQIKKQLLHKKSSRENFHYDASTQTFSVKVPGFVPALADVYMEKH